MKMIDIWLLFGLTIPFLVFILEVISQILRRRKKIRRGATNEISLGMQNIIHSTIFGPLAQMRCYNAQLEREKYEIANEKVDDKDNEDIDYTFLEKVILKYKVVMIPLTTKIFILGYIIAALVYRIVQH